VRGKTIMPALVDAHSHLGYTDVRTGITAAASYTRDSDAAVVEDWLRKRGFVYDGIGVQGT